MWFLKPNAPANWSAAIEFLSAQDPVMCRLIEKVGPCTLSPRRDYFVKLCQSIFSQQVSTAVAAVLFGRFRNRFPLRRPTPHRVLEFVRSDETVWKSVGLSRQKRAYLEDLATRFVNGEIPTRRFCSMEDEQIVQALTPVKGIGRWTVEMFLIFCLNRPDVWPVDDLGVKLGVQRHYGHKAILPKPQLIDFGNRWRPWRSIATWYLWRGSSC